MIIDNEDLFNNKCVNCKHHSNHNCHKPSWIVPHSNACLSFAWGKYQGDVAPSFLKYISNRSSWADLNRSAQYFNEVSTNKTTTIPHINDGFEDVEYVHSSPNELVKYAIQKRAAEFTEIVPQRIFYCSACNRYYQKNSCPNDFSHQLDAMEIGVENLIELVTNAAMQSRFWNTSANTDMIGFIRGLELEDINIHEG